MKVARPALLIYSAYYAEKSLFTCKKICIIVVSSYRINLRIGEGVSTELPEEFDYG